MSTKIMSHDEEIPSFPRNTRIKNKHPLSTDQKQTQKLSDEGQERIALDNALKRWEASPEIEIKISSVSTILPALEDPLKKAYFIGSRYLDKQFISTLFRHNDKEGNFNLISSLHYDVHDFSKLPAGRYRFVLKYWDWYMRIKGGKFGGLRTVWRDFYKEDENQNSEDWDRGGRERTEQKPEKFREALAEIERQFNEATEYHLETIRTRQKLEKAAYDQGFEAGRKAAFLELQPPQASPSGNDVILELLKAAMSGKGDDLAAILSKAGH